MGAHLGRIVGEYELGGNNAHFYGSHPAPRALSANSLLARVCVVTVIGMTASRSDAISVAPSYSATGVCVGGVSQFAYTFYGLPQSAPTVVTLGIFDGPDTVASGTPVSVGPGTTSVLWDIAGSLVHAGSHVISVHIGSTGIPATHLNSVPFWPVTSSYAITLRQCGTSPPSFVGLSSTPHGLGYWQATSDGQVLGFGDAWSQGWTSGTLLNRPIVDLASTSDGNGYWLVASDGGVFTFGDASFLGSTGALMLNRPVVGMTSTPDGRGYWLVASDGGVFTFGDALFLGTIAGAASVH